MSYEALYTSLTNVRTHPNADRLLLATAAGYQVVVGLDAKDGDEGIFFGDGGQIDEEFLISNELFNEAAIAVLFPDYKAENWSFGFFSLNRRVRAQAFRGQKSEGFFCPAEFLGYTGYDITKLKVGDVFSELNGVPICQKYLNPATLRAMKGSTQKMRKQRNVIFPKHIDTKQFRFFKTAIPDGAIVYISEKAHGTSLRFGNVLETRELSWLTRALDRLSRRETPNKQWRHLNGSRNVILNDQNAADAKGGFYGSNDFRFAATEGITLHKGEIIYGELVGFVHETQPIMQVQVLKDKAMIKQFGPVMSYTYGCAAGETKLLIYRITRVNEDGVETDLSWPQVVQRSRQLGLEVVPLVTSPFFYEHSMADSLEMLVQELADGVSVLDARHIREGVVVRIESESGTTWLKEKNFTFKVLEGIVKDSEAVDLEEAA